MEIFFVIRIFKFNVLDLIICGVCTWTVTCILVDPLSTLACTSDHMIKKNIYFTFSFIHLEHV